MKKQILYVELKFDEKSVNRLESFQDSIISYLDCKDMEVVDKDDFHVTVIYSENLVPYKTMDVKGKEIKVTLKPSIWSIRGGEEDIVVLELENDFIENRHHYGRHIGATSTYKEYRPHITMIYGLGSTKNKKLIESLRFETNLVLEVENASVSED